MTTKSKDRKVYLPALIFFIVFNAFLLTSGSLLLKWGIHQGVVLVGNLVLFAVTAASLLLYQRAMTHASTQGFLRNTYSGLLLKLFACMLAMAIYAVAAGHNINKAGILVCVFLYFVYSIIEMRSLMRWNKLRKNA